MKSYFLVIMPQSSQLQPGYVSVSPLAVIYRQPSEIRHIEGFNRHKTEQTRSDDLSRADMKNSAKDLDSTML